jgi:hypothetical protein
MGGKKETQQLKKQNKQLKALKKAQKEHKKLMAHVYRVRGLRFLSLLTRPFN